MILVHAGTLFREYSAQHLAMLATVKSRFPTTKYGLDDRTYLRRVSDASLFDDDEIVLLLEDLVFR